MIGGHTMQGRFAQTSIAGSRRNQASAIVRAAVARSSTARSIVRSTLLLFGLALVPSTVLAQASITGVVKDISGAVLPGVTVEVSSAALIEQVRSALTDATGQYRIVDLRPGIYTVTFTLTGFSSLKREGLELTGSFTATVNADLRVGGLAETITVTGETPIVDVQSATKQRVLNAEIIEAIPTGRSQYQPRRADPGRIGVGRAGCRWSRRDWTPPFR